MNNTNPTQMGGGEEGVNSWNARHFGTGTNRHLCEIFRYQDKSAPQLDKSAPQKDESTLVFFSLILRTKLLHLFFFRSVGKHRKA
jgi:hypothetical protein